MSGIDPSIVVHEIKTYPTARSVRQKLRQVHLRKAAAIKAEVEKILKVGFIYPIPLTEWVSNIVPVNKKQGTIRVCIDFWYLNKACPKDNFSTPHIDQIIDNCAGSVIFSFMDGFLGYNQIEILPVNQHKTTFICLWGTFSYKKLPFGLKNAGATFQHSMSYAFHDIKNTIEQYLDDLPVHSQQWEYHPQHLRDIFLRCRHYKIWLNPHKCVFLHWDKMSLRLHSLQGWYLDWSLKYCFNTRFTCPNQPTWIPKFAREGKISPLFRLQFRKEDA